MDTTPSPRTELLSPARLVIHAEDHVGVRDRPLEAAPWRSRGSRPGVRGNDSRAPLSLHIDNLQGLRVHSVDDAGPLVDVPLPAGTYHVTVHFGKVRRSYTMTLEAGASFDLYLRLAPDRQ